MSVSLRAQVGARHFEQKQTLGQKAERQVLASPEQVERELGQAIDAFFPTIDETQADGALGEPGLVRYHTNKGERLVVEYTGDSQNGSYTQEWVGGGYIHAQFSQEAVDALVVGPNWTKHLHVDRASLEDSYVEFLGEPWSVFGELPKPAGPPEVPEEQFVTTPTGLSYAVLEEGQGAEARFGHPVLVHYTGWLSDGEKFDSSLDRGQAFEFPLGAGKVIRGWDEGVQGMKEGERRLLKVPSHLGYGERGAPPAIPPNADLLFEVRLLAAGG